ncbi:MAG: hypothetical protein ACLUD2_17605 [Clostridium sp.]
MDQHGTHEVLMAEGGLYKELVMPAGNGGGRMKTEIQLFDEHEPPPSTMGRPIWKYIAISTLASILEPCRTWA